MSGDSDGTFRLLMTNLNPVISTTGGIVISTAAILGLLALCYFFSLCDYAAGSANVSALKQFSEQGNSGAGLALKIKGDMIKYSRSAQTGFSLNAIALVIIAELTYTAPIRAVLSDLIPDSGIASAIAVILIFMLVSVFVITFGQLIPGRIAAEDSDKTLIRCARPFFIMCILIAPFVFVCSGLTNIILKIFGHNTNKNTNQVTEEKILRMVDEGKEDGFIEGNTKNMIENVFDFDDTTVGEIMTHRKDVVAVKDSLKITELTKTAIESGYSRIPVYHENIDSITGIIYVKDLLQYVSTNVPTEHIGKAIIREAVFVPESKRCSEMFEYMTKHKNQIAIVVDEFGGTGGIITMEDLIESIVGSIQDEYDNEDDEIKRVSESSFSVDGATSLDEITDLTGIRFDDESNDTIAGVMLDRMGHIPKSGEHPSIVINGTRFTVQEIDNRRISKVLIVKNNKKQ